MLLFRLIFYLFIQQRQQIYMKNIIIVLLLIAASQAWWDKGHMLVSRIAWNHLTNTNRTDVRDKLNVLVEALNPFTDGRTNTFTEAAVWADDIKGYGASMFDNYHFTNIVYDPDYTFNGMTSYQQDVNAVNTINWCKSVLKANKEGVSFERAWMTRYLLHVVGDIHQPLHSTNFFNGTYKTGDLGGNLIKMTLANGTTNFNLHAYFDSIALEQDPVTRIIRPLNDTFRATIEAEAVQLMKTYTADSLADLIAIKDPKVWGVESFEFAVEKIYAYTKLTNQITEEYQSEIRPLLQKRIALAGYRLAETIAQIYA